MILIGMFDSPFVRRVAITLSMFELAFEHRDWSVGKDIDLIKQYNPLGRVPTLVLPGGETLIDSAAILDYLDEVAGAERALLPRSGPERRDALRILALATGAAEKGVLQIYERVFRPESKRHEPWIERCRTQMQSALGELDRLCQAGKGDWLIGGRMTQADITTACVFTFLSEALGAGGQYPALAALTLRCEELRQFKAIKAQFNTPVS